MPVGSVHPASLPKDHEWGSSFEPASRSTLQKGTFSDILSWQREQARKDDPIAASLAKKNHLKENMQVMTAMLQSVSNNPFEENGIEGLRILQGLVESMSRMEQEETLKDIARHIKETNFLQASSLVGHKGEFLSHTFKVDKTQEKKYADEVSYEVSKTSKPIAELVVELYGPQGNKIAVLQGPNAPGRHSLEQITDKLPNGSYSFQVRAVDAQGEVVDIDHLVSSRVESVAKDLSGLMMRVGDGFEPVSHLKGITRIDNHTTTNYVNLPPEMAALFPPSQNLLNDEIPPLEPAFPLNQDN